MVDRSGAYGGSATVTLVSTSGRRPRPAKLVGSYSGNEYPSKPRTRSSKDRRLATFETLDMCEYIEVSPAAARHLPYQVLFLTHAAAPAPVRARQAHSPRLVPQLPPDRSQVPSPHCALGVLVSPLEFCSFFSFSLFAYWFFPRTNKICGKSRHEQRERLPPLPCPSAPPGGVPP